MKINEKLLGLLVVGIMVLGILGASAMGLWSTENEKKPSLLTEAEGIKVTGLYDPEDIRGSYTFKEVSEFYNIDLTVLREAFQVPEDRDIETFKSKDIESLYEASGSAVGNGSLKVFVALYKNLPIYLGEDQLPETAVALILKNNPAITTEAKSYLETHTVPGQPVSNNSGTADSAEEPAINGQSTFQSALDLGISKTVIETIIGAPMPPTHQSIRDYCRSNGLQFSEIKAELLKLLE